MPLAYDRRPSMLVPSGEPGTFDAVTSTRAVSHPGTSRMAWSGDQAQKGSLQRVQPCRDFLHNRCSKGDQCIYSHDIDHIREVNQQQDGSCMRFIFGVCTLPLCRFKHDVSMVKSLLLAELQNDTPSSSWDKSGICLEFLKGTCDKGLSCPFSHTLQDYYTTVCKRHPYVSVAKQSVAEAIRTTVGLESNSIQESAPDVCHRAYILRCVVPVLFPGQPKRAEAFIAALKAHPTIAANILSIHEYLEERGKGER